MLEKLFNLIKGSADDSVINNPDIPNDKNEEVVAEATNTVAGGLRNMIAGGGLESVLSLFGNKQNNQQSSGGLMSNPIVSMMIGHFAGKLMSKFGMGGNSANKVAGSLIPSALTKLVNQTNDPADNGFSLDNLLSSITGGRSREVASQQQSNSGGFDLQNLIGQFTGSGGQQGGLANIISQFAGGAQEQQARNGGGGLLDMIKGFIK